MDAFPVKVRYLCYFSACIVFVALAVSFRIFHTDHISHDVIGVTGNIPFSVYAFCHPVQGIIPIPGDISLCIFHLCDVSPCIIGKRDPAFICLPDGLWPAGRCIGDLHFISKGIFRFYKPSLGIVFPAQFFLSVYLDPDWLVLFSIPDFRLISKGVDHTHQISCRIIGILGFIPQAVHI